MNGWVCRIMKEEKCNESTDCMLDYLIALLDDSKDFSKQSAKASQCGSVVSNGSGGDIQLVTN